MNISVFHDYISQIEDIIEDRRRVKEYGVGAQILLDLGLKDMILLTDTPEKKVVALGGYGLNIVDTHAICGTRAAPAKQP